MAIAGTLDFGIGNGILNRIVSSNQRGDMDEVQNTISTALWMSIGISLLVAASFALTYKLIPWVSLFKLNSTASILEIGPTISILVACVCFGIPLNLIAQIQLGMQQGHVTSRWQSLGQIMVSTLIFLAANLGGGLRSFVAVTFAVPLFVLVGNWCEFYFRFSLVGARRPRLKRFNVALAANLFRTSSVFFLLQIVSIGAFGSDLIMISAIVGPQQVPEYSVTQRYFSVVQVIFSMLLMPLWPAYRDALDRGDVTWAASTFKKSVAITALSSTLAVGVLLVFLHPLLFAWLGKNIQVSTELAIGLATFAVLRSVGDALGMLLNAVSAIRFQLVIASMFGITSVVVKVITLRVFGLQSLPWAGALSFTLLDLIPVMLLIPKIFASLEERSKRMYPLPSHVLKSEKRRLN